MHKGAKIPSTLPGMNVPWVLKFQGTKVLYMDFLLPGAKSLGSEKSRYAYLYSAPLNRYTCYGAIEVVAIIIYYYYYVPSFLPSSFFYRKNVAVICTTVESLDEDGGNSRYIELMLYWPFGLVVTRWLRST